MTWKKIHAALAMLVAAAAIYSVYNDHDWQWTTLGLFAAALITLTYGKLVVKVVLKNDGSEVTVDASRVEN